MGTVDEMQKMDEEDEKDRAPVYREGDKLVFRASALGYCEKALAAYGSGLTPVGPPDWLQAKYDQGVENEPRIMDLLWEKHDIQVNGQQQTVEIANSKLILRGHIDGRGTHDGVTKVVEAKAFAPSTLAAFESGGWDRFYYYAVQLSVYMHALNLPGLFVVGIKDEDNVVQKLQLFPFDEPMVSRGKLFSRALRIVKYIEEDELPACDYAQYPCGFHFLHDGEKVHEGKERIEVVDKEADRLAAEYYAAEKGEKQLKARREAARDGLLKILESKGLMDKKMETAGYIVTPTVQHKSGRVDYKKMEADGVEVGTYRSEGTTSRFVKVEPRVEGQDVSGRDGARVQEADDPSIKGDKT